jgi:hypothetical protein
MRMACFDLNHENMDADTHQGRVIGWFCNANLGMSLILNNSDWGFRPN